MAAAMKPNWTRRFQSAVLLAEKSIIIPHERAGWNGQLLYLKAAQPVCEFGKDGHGRSDGFFRVRPGEPEHGLIFLHAADGLAVHLEIGRSKAHGNDLRLHEVDGTNF